MADAIGRFDFSAANFPLSEVDLYQTGVDNNKRVPEEREAVAKAFETLAKAGNTSFEFGMQRSMMAVMYDPESGELAIQRLNA